MSDDGPPAADEGGDDIGVVVLMLGLYLIVLAFFILLNAISEDSPDRQELVVESVREGFDFREEGPGRGSDPTDITAPPAYEAVIQSLDGVLQSHLQVDQYDVTGDSEKVQMRLDIDRFFYPGEVRIIPDMILFFEDLAKTVQDRRAGTSMRLQVMVSGDESTLNADTPYDDFSLAGRRSTLFTRALIAEGVDQKQISAGAFKAEPSLIMTFHIFEAEATETTEQLHEVMDKLKVRSDNNNNRQGGAF